MLYATVLAAALSFFTFAQAATLIKEYSGNGFFDAWNFQNSPDTTTHGQVQYVDQGTASNEHLAYVNSAGHAIVAVDDTTNLAAGALRNSVRITSTQTYSIGSLVVADFTHIPYGCSIWGAFWMLGPNWPTTGEIDIIEGVNAQTQNQMTLHTSAGCSHDPSAPETGSPLDTSCESGGSSNNGCGVVDPSTQSYAGGFSSAGGGVYATSWTSAGISIWRWNRASIPADVRNGNPDSSTWGTPVATWSASECDPGTHFQSLALVINISLCGDWAGQASVWSASSCSQQYATCADAVSNAANFQESYFEVNSIKVYNI